jgi:hypothetical protein
MRFHDSNVRILNLELNEHLKNIYKLLNSIKRRNLKAKLTSTDKMLISIDKSAIIIMMYSFLEFFLSKILILIYQSIRNDPNGKFSDLSNKFKDHISDNIMKINRGTPLTSWKNHMAQKLYDDLDQCKTFPIMNSLLIEYS